MYVDLHVHVSRFTCTCKRTYNLGLKVRPAFTIHVADVLVLREGNESGGEFFLQRSAGRELHTYALDVANGKVFSLVHALAGDGGAERTEVAQTYAVACLDLFAHLILQGVEYGLDVCTAHGAGALYACGDVSKLYGLDGRHKHVVADFVGCGDALGTDYVFHNCKSYKLVKWVI